MPSSVQHLIESKQAPLTITPQEPAKRALELMADNDYSQLPVIDTNNKPIGIVTSDSILNAEINFGVHVDGLQVSSAMDRPRKCHPEDELFELLDKLKESNSVLVVGRDEHLVGIVTNYDTSEYFRKRAEDMMLIEDVENALVQHIQAAFSNQNGELDNTSLAAAIQEVTSQTSV